MKIDAGNKIFGDTKEFEKQAFDYHMPMGSLPRLFRSDIKDFDGLFMDT